MYFLEGFRGTYYVDGKPPSDPERPTFCHACGQPYPWARERLTAAQEMARELEALDDSEREMLVESLEDILTDGPRTELGASRVKRLLAKAGVSGRALYNVAMDFASKTAAEVINSHM